MSLQPRYVVASSSITSVAIDNFRTVSDKEILKTMKRTNDDILNVRWFDKTDSALFTFDINHKVDKESLEMVRKWL